MTVDVVFDQPLTGVSVQDGSGGSEHPIHANGQANSDPEGNREIELLERTETLLQQVFESVIETEERRGQSLFEMQKVAVELAVAIASRVVHEKVEARDFAIEELVMQAIEAVGGTEPITIRLNPDDITMLNERLRHSEVAWAQATDVKIVGDPTIERGGCLAETPDASILSRIETQLAEIRQHLIQSLYDAQTERRKTNPNDRQLRRFPDRRHTA